MPTSPARQAEGGREKPELYDNVACPFCGMLCDDLEIERSGDTLKLRKNGCARAKAGFERKLPASSPSVKGKDVDLATAAQAAARLIGKAKLPLFGGLATDVEGMRAVLALAERSGGIVDHAASEAMYRNFKVVQTTGWITTTLTETRNRADLIIVAGSDLARVNPRFFERIAAPADSMFGVIAPKRTVVFIGKGLDGVAKGTKIGEVVTLACKPEQASDVVAVLRARLRGFRIGIAKLDGVTLAEIDALAERCRQAKYGVVVWAPPSLDFPHAELAVDQFVGLIKDLNQTTRFAGLPLGGADGAPTAAAVTTWQSGYPLRVSYASGAPDYDPNGYAIERMLADGEGDLLVWIASISPDFSPPETKISTVVLGTPGLKLRAAPDVFIPVGTPGVDDAGRMIRVDGVVSLPLKNLGRAQLPSAADALAAIEAAL
jgi:formylmethanofuran dehydrogenase subunit B